MKSNTGGKRVVVTKWISNQQDLEPMVRVPHGPLQDARKTTMANFETHQVILSMIRLLKLLTAAILIVTAVSCHRKGFTDITERDQTGQTTGAIDESDWQLGSEKFPRKIRKAMEDLGCQGSSSELGVANEVFAFANPVSSSFALYFDVTNVNVKIIIATWGSKILYEECIFMDRDQSLSFSTDDLGFESGKHYRVYYEISPVSGSTTVQGHGDLMME